MNENGNETTGPQKTETVLSSGKKPAFEILRSDAFDEILSSMLHGTAMSVERYKLNAYTILRSDPKLASTSPESFFGALLRCAQLGLEPNTKLGLAFLVPFYSNKLKGYECVLILGYKGVINLAYRSPRVSGVSAHVVYKQDEFRVEYGTRESILHVPCCDANTQTKENALGAYGIIRLVGDGVVQRYLQRDEVLSARPPKRGQSVWDDSIWFREAEMWLKTAILRAAKYAPISEEMSTAIVSDEMAARGARWRWDAERPENGVIIAESENGIAAPVLAQASSFAPAVVAVAADPEPSVEKGEKQ